VAVVHDSQALVLRRVELGEADLIVTLFTLTLGRVSVLARGARRSKKRFAGALEPFFTLQARFEERTRSELFVLIDADVTRPRLGLLSELSRLEVAGRALGWVRKTAPPRTPEPEAFQLMERLLDRLSNGDATLSPERELSEIGLALLASFGWGVDLEHCVRCGKACPETSIGMVDPMSGGLVCRSCGSGRMRIPAARRLRLVRAAQGEQNALLAEDANTALELVERVFAAHAGVE
jgi:DNA repair protein RecO (recombination protein O)